MDGSPPALAFASFWVRLAASLADHVIAGVLVTAAGAGLGVVFVFAIALMAAGNLGPNTDLREGAPLLLAGFIVVGALAITLVLLVCYLLYFVLFTAWRGQTPGKMLLRVRVVDLEGGPPGLRRAFMREVVGKFLSSSLLYAGHLWPLWDAQRQAWHDKIAGTYVIREAGGGRRDA